jgi:hypothetical protein
MYDATFGRFLQRDPIGALAGGPNPYAYAGDDPTGLTDPFGADRDVPTQSDLHACDCPSLSYSNCVREAQRAVATLSDVRGKVFCKCTCYYLCWSFGTSSAALPLPGESGVVTVAAGLCSDHPGTFTPPRLVARRTSRDLPATSCCRTEPCAFNEARSSRSDAHPDVSGPPLSRSCDVIRPERPASMVIQLTVPFVPLRFFETTKEGKCVSTRG